MSIINNAFFAFIKKVLYVSTVIAKYAENF